ncbi:MAG: urea ABC transporter ATP-binding subunit UrtE [Gammaproteobacteria bacterium]|nr:urea ABC transporter ATP-binding subunit UrtE [Gammaproteobacteria bacterium]
MLEIKGLNQFYGESHTLWDVDLKIEQGDCVCLMGRNGVGKTTLLKSIMGLIPCKSGSIRYEQTELLKYSAEKRAKSGIGYVPQGREIFPQLTVEENLKIGLSSRRDKVKTIPSRIFELFPVLKEMMHRRGGDLSGGQQQQLAIGRALVLDPKVLILDEPTEGIQPNIVHDIGSILLKLNQEEGITVLIVEQKLPFARRVGKKFMLMDRGRNVALGKMEELDEALIQKYLTV